MNNASKTLIAAAMFATAGLAFAQTDRNNSGSNRVDSSDTTSIPAAGDDPERFDRQRALAGSHGESYRSPNPRYDRNRAHDSVPPPAIPRDSTTGSDSSND
jgi:hypothetical protein